MQQVEWNGGKKSQLFLSRVKSPPFNKVLRQHFKPQQPQHYTDCILTNALRVVSFRCSVKTSEQVCVNLEGEKVEATWRRHQDSPCFPKPRLLVHRFQPFLLVWCCRGQGLQPLPLLSVVLSGARPKPGAKLTVSRQAKKTKQKQPSPNHHTSLFSHLMLKTWFNSFQNM